MKNLLKDKKVIVGAVVVLALGYYLYDQKRKANLKARAEVLASTPATTTITATEVTTPPIVKSTTSSAGAIKTEM